MRVLGIDPGLSATGFAVIETREKDAHHVCEFGCIRTYPKTPTEERLNLIFERITSISEKWTPELIVLEDVFVRRDAPKAIVHLGEVRGIILLAAHKMKMRVMQISPAEVKSSLTGSGRADKEQVEKALRRFLNIQEEIEPSHASDALAIAFTGILRMNSKKILSKRF